MPIGNVTMHRTGVSYGGAPTAGGSLIRSGSSGGGADVSNLIASLQASHDAANKAGMAQYQNLLGTVAGLKKNLIGKGGVYSQAAGLLTSQGATAKADMQDTIKNDLGSVEQDMVNRGLGNTSIRSNMLTGTKLKGQRELSRIDENVAAARAGLLERQAGMAAQLGHLETDSILSRSNEGPDMSQYLDLIARLAASSQGGGSAAGGGTPQSTIFSNMGSINALNNWKPFQNSSFR